MSTLDLLVIAVSLASDAFSVSLCRGLKMKKLNIGHSAVIAGFFGVFQALMPVLGYYLGLLFSGYIEAIDHYVAFGLLAVIGGKMIFDAVKGDGDECESCGGLDLKELTVMAFATSIDAFAVGITFAISDVNIAFSAAVIGLVTFTLCLIGVFIGSVFGARHKNKATLIGGVVLILIGLKILLEGIGVFA